MRIVFDQGVYDMRNKGNVALTQVAIRRIGTLWPAARLEVMTSAPGLVRLYCPGAHPIFPNGSRAGNSPSRLIDRISNLAPRPVLRVLLEVRDELRERRLRSEPSDDASSRATMSERSAVCRSEVSAHFLDGADLYVVTGAQFMSDACPDNAFAVFDRIEQACHRGIPAVMVGQGVGPFENAELRARAAAVYPLAELIFVRDRRAVPLLLSFGVDSSRVIFTGDDAIEMAHDRRSEVAGRAIGVSIRLAHYTSVAAADLAAMRSALHGARSRYGARLIPIPISHSLHELDARAINELIADRPRQPFQPKLRSPEGLIEIVGRCRIVVTAAFHPAVFALSQGIPAVCLARTPMYVEKFNSLADVFGEGCAVVPLGEGSLARHLTEAIDGAWRDADRLRPILREAARRQAAVGRSAYGRLRAVVAKRSGTNTASAAMAIR